MRLEWLILYYSSYYCKTITLIFVSKEEAYVKFVIPSLGDDKSNILCSFITSSNRKELSLYSVTHVKQTKKYQKLIDENQLNHIRILLVFCFYHVHVPLQSFSYTNIEISLNNSWFLSRRLLNIVYYILQLCAIYPSTFQNMYLVW